MPLYAGELNLRRGATLDEYPASLGQVLGAQSDDTRLNNPLSAIRRMQALSDAERGPYVGDERNEFGAVVPRFQPPQRLDAATARERVKAEGLPLTIPDDGIAAPALDILIRAKREELQRQSIFARGPSGVVPGTLRLGTALINSLYDPLNIASAFIPVVGPARYGAMVAGASGAAGRAGIRAGVGAVEGVAGAAILEPLIYSANQQEQADYGMADSLANIAFGGLFGGGLHAGGGAVRDFAQPDWWKATPPGRSPDEAASIAGRVAPETQQSAMRASIVQAIEGRQTEVDAIVRSDPFSDPLSMYSDAAERLSKTLEEMGLNVRRESSRASRSEYVYVEIQGKEVKFRISNHELPGYYGTGIRADFEVGVTPNDLGAGHIAGDWIDAAAFAADRSGRKIPQTISEIVADRRRQAAQAEAMQEQLRQELRARKNENIAALSPFLDWINSLPADAILKPKSGSRKLNAWVGDKIISSLNDKPQGFPNGKTSLDDARKFVEKNTPPATSSEASFGTPLGGMQERAVRADETGSPELAQESAAGGRATLSEITAAAQANARPEAIRSADPRSSAASEQTARQATPATLESAQAQLDEAMTAADDFAAALGEPDRISQSLKDYDLDIKRAEDYAKALRAGAACGLA